MPFGDQAIQLVCELDKICHRAAAAGGPAHGSSPSRILGSIAWSIVHRASSRGLKCLAHVGVAVRTVHLPLAAEVETSDLRVADRPTAIVGEERIDGLLLTKPSFGLDCRQGPRRALNLIHKAP